jgi:hypothetical protein
MLCCCLFACHADAVANSPDALFQQLAQTVLQQSTLCPLPLVVQPVHWAHDHALQLYPLPHALVLADASPQSSVSYDGCTVLNPVRSRCCCCCCCCCGLSFITQVRLCTTCVSCRQRSKEGPFVTAAGYLTRNG